MDGIMTVAYIGNGKSTNRYHLPFVLAGGEKIQVKTIWERTDRSAQWTRVPGVRYTKELSVIMEDPEVDVVIITTPVTAHYPLIKAALEAGKNCVCEKPFTRTLSEAEELFQMAEEKGFMLQCYQNRRFDSDYLTVKKVIQEGKLGKLFEMEMHFDYYRPEVPLKEKGYKREHSFLFGHACHTLDQVISFMGTPDYYSSDVRAMLGKNHMNDYFDIDLYYDGCKVSVKSSYYRIKPRPSFVVYGQRGMFVKETTDKQEQDLKHYYLPANHDFGEDLPADYGTLIYYDSEGVYHEEKVPSVRGNYSCYYDALYETMIHGKEPLVKKEETLLQMRILEACIRQMEDGWKNENQCSGSV